MLDVTLISVHLNYAAVSHAQGTPPALQITSPANGTVVAPGETITVVVAPAPGMTFSHVIILGENPIGDSQIKTAPPYEFSLTIPTNISARSYRITARGVITPGTGAKSLPISLTVEKPEPIAQIRVEPTLIKFESISDQIPLRVIGTFSDGKKLTITESTHTTYTSGNQNVASVDHLGLVTAVGPGTTQITVGYGGQSIKVPVSVSTMSKSRLR